MLNLVPDILIKIFLSVGHVKSVIPIHVDFCKHSLYYNNKYYCQSENCQINIVNFLVTISSVQANKSCSMPSARFCSQKKGAVKQ